jgi:uncharacterized protein
MNRHEIEVEVVYALPLRQDVTRLRVTSGTSVGEAIERSGVIVRHPELGTGDHRLAIYGRPVKAGAVLRDRDRVEILRPLTADPKQARKRRASQRPARAAS